MASIYDTARARIKMLPPEQLHAFLSERRNAILATVNKDGTPQCTPVSFYWDGAAFYASTVKEAVKYKNLKRDPPGIGSGLAMMYFAQRFIAANGRRSAARL